MANVAKLGIVTEGSDEPNDIADTGFNLKVTDVKTGAEWSKTTAGYTKDIGMAPSISGGELDAAIHDDDPNDFEGTRPVQPDEQGVPSDFLGSKSANPKQKIQGFAL